MAELAREIEASLIVGEDKAVADTRRWSRIGYAILAGTFGLSIVWSSLAPLSSAVVAQGSVKVDSSRKKIQHPEGGVVKAILVKDGSTVKAGDVLVRLDETKAGAAYGVVKGGREVALAAQARLEAERDERSSIVFPKVLTRQANEPQIAEILRSQESVFSARRASRLGEVGILERQIGALRSEIAGLQSQQRSKQEQAASVKAELDGLASLASQGMVEKTKIRTIERDLTRLLGERDELASKVASANTAISEKELKKFQVKKAFHEEVVAELKKVQAENFELIERESATRYTLEQTELRAPVDGTVTDLKIHTAGGVIGPRRSGDGGGAQLRPADRRRQGAAAGHRPGGAGAGCGRQAARLQRTHHARAQGQAQLRVGRRGARPAHRDELLHRQGHGVGRRTEATRRAEGAARHADRRVHHYRRAHLPGLPLPAAGRQLQPGLAGALTGSLLPGISSHTCCQARAAWDR
jgi:HlyD family type I secretion membrane fusion protein